MKIKYLGDHEREFIPATGARPFVATPGDVVEVDEETAESLLDQPAWFEAAEASVAPRNAEVRAWANEQNIEVPARGKVPDDVVAAYVAAQEAKETD